MNDALDTHVGAAVAESLTWRKLAMRGAITPMEHAGREMGRV